MEFIFELLIEIIMEPIIEGYVFAMSLVSKESKKINAETAKCIVAFEGIVLMIIFVVGGVMLLETNGESLVGKIVFASSIVISFVQILIGLILNKRKKKQKEIG